MLGKDVAHLSTSSIINSYSNRDLEDTRIWVRSARNEHMSRTPFRDIHETDMCLKLCKNYSIENSAAAKDALTHAKFDDLLNVEHTKTRGYMLSFRYYEQQTQATRTLLQMQCFADSIGSTIVEPFVFRSSFSIRFQEFSSSIEPTDQFLTLTDLIDTELWNREAFNRYGYHPISSWKDFIKHAPRNVIVHCIRYRNPPRIPIPRPGHNYRMGCTKDCFKRFNESLSFLSKFGFKMVRKSCSNVVTYAGAVTTSNFVENILGNYKASEVSVLINEFRGFFGLYRLPVLSECGIRHFEVDVPVMPSARIRTDARKYSKVVFSGRPYVAILARIERVVFQLHHDIEQCAKEVESVLKQLRSSQKLSDIFLAMDVGKFGSSGAALKNLQPHGETLFQSIYQEKWSFKEWEETFERLAWSNNSAYVANLQRTIAAKGDCLVMVGAGGFQAQARTLYEKFHPDSNSWCVFKVCSEENVKT